MSDDVEWQKLEEHYRRDYPRFQEAASSLEEIIHEVIARIEDRRLVRVRVRGVRIKKFESLKAKSILKGWTPAEAISRCTDIVGARVVCNNIEDIYRFSELFCEIILLDAIQKQDFVACPQYSGYRAVHLNFRIERFIGPPEGHLMALSSYSVPCELQIRTLLQDSWAELVHEDIYKHGATLPGDLSGRAQDLATLLASADEIAARIRTRVAQQSGPTQSHPDTSELTEDSLRYVFARVFGRNPSDYAVQSAKNLCENLGVASAEAVGRALEDQAFRDKLETAYAESLGFQAKLTKEEFLMLAPYAAANKPKLAFKEAQRSGRKEREYIENISRREALSSLPDDRDELISAFENPQKDGDFLYDLDRWAEALGVSQDCAICGTTVIDPHELAWAIVEERGLSGDEADELADRISAAVVAQGAEVGHWRDSSMCSYCGESFFKDD